MESDETPCDALFNCTQCGDCCNGYGGTYLSSMDIESIANFLGITAEQFVTDYTTVSGDRRLIRQGDNGYCVFWDQICTIHSVKPKMCRQWPYISSILIDVGNWRAMAASCPGMNADAPEDDILDCVRKKVAD
jgi:uncharacterized protein